MSHRSPSHVSRRLSQAGYTLPEVIIALAAFALMMTGLFASFAYGFANLKATREDLRATQILTGKLEAIRLCNWSQLLSNCPSSFTDYYDPLAGSANRGEVYRGSLSIVLPTNISNSISYRDKMRLVTISVSWDSTARGTTVTHTRQMQTYSALFGIQNYIWGAP